MNEEEFQEQLQAASQFIIDGAQEAKDFKTGGQSYKAAAEAYKILNDKAIDMMSKRPEAVVPESVFKNIQSSAAAGVRSQKCQTPTSNDLIPVLRAAYKEISPEIQYRRVLKIHGKFLFCLSVPILLLSGFLFWRDYRLIHFGTPESWANRNYIAAIQLGETDPGNAYDVIIRQFDAGRDADAKELVTLREVKAKEYGITSREWEMWITGYLANVKDFKEGIAVITWEEKKERGKKVSFVVFRDLNTQEEWKLLQTADGFNAFTNDEKINTLKEATNKKNSERKIWRYQGDNYPYTPMDGE